MNRHTLSPGIKQLWPAVILALLISGCTTTPRPTLEPQEHLPSQQRYTPDDTLAARAQIAEAQGNVVIAAREYRTLAQQSPSPWREQFWLKAANALARGGYIEEANQIIGELAQQPLPPNQQIELRIVNARIALKQGHSSKALEILNLPDADADAGTRQHLHHLRAEAFEASGNHLDAARERMAADALISDADARLQNQQRLWLTLDRLTTDALQNAITEPPPSVFSGWLELMFYVKSSVADPAQLEAQLELWRSRYPAHPAAEQFFDHLIANKNELTGRPQKIALLLPLSGNFAAPAAAVRDGFLAAYYARQARDDYTPDIRIYDTEGSPETGLQIYQQAVDDGADFIVGPLDKHLVEQLAQATDIDTPTLALNYAQTENRHRKLFQYGLLPEDEARQVAERAWLDGHDNAIVLIPEGEWGERMGATFAQHWERLSGTVLETQTYEPSKNDFSTPVKKLLNIDESKARYQQLKQRLKADIKFEPRRRQDVDFIFSAAFPRQARQIRPQLKFFYAADLPIYSTSHAYTGVENVTLDRDMDDIMFCDMPWVLSPRTDTSPNWSEIETQWQRTAHAFKRLYAMGVDAYRLIPWLRYLRSHREEHLTGETGNLYLDNSNRIHRQLTWARFQGGRARLDKDSEHYVQPF